MSLINQAIYLLHLKLVISLNKLIHFIVLKELKELNNININSLNLFKDGLCFLFS